jgi:hypothetical protein
MRHSDVISDCSYVYETSVRTTEILPRRNDCSVYHTPLQVFVDVWLKIALFAIWLMSLDVE